MTENKENVADELSSDTEDYDGIHVEETPLETVDKNQTKIHRSLLSLVESSDTTFTEVLEFLNGQSEQDLCTIQKELKDDNTNLLKENEVYVSSLEADGPVTSVVGTDLPIEKLQLLPWNLKCYYANMRLKNLEKTLDDEKSRTESHILELQFNLENLNRSFDDLKTSKTKFSRDVQSGGRHPVTKRVILQKVAKYFDDSIKSKMTLTNRYKIQIQSNTMECNKLSSQIKEQEKRLASLDLVKYQQAKFDFDKSCKSLIDHRDQLSKCKSKFSLLSQKVHEAKKNLEREKEKLDQTVSALKKKEYVKNVMVTERTRNEEKIRELNADMKKMSLDPRRHGLPEVFEYAKVKKENEALKKNIALWKKKVSVVQQAKRIHLMTQKKR